MKVRGNRRNPKLPRKNRWLLKPPRNPPPEWKPPEKPPPRNPPKDPPRIAPDDPPRIPPPAPPRIPPPPAWPPRWASMGKVQIKRTGMNLRIGRLSLPRSLAPIVGGRKPGGLLTKNHTDKNVCATFTRR